LTALETAKIAPFRKATVEAQPAPRIVARRRAAAYVALALLISIPCFWQPHIQADDLSSHLYNAWLVNQVQAGQLPGLYVVPQFTNVLFDRLLSFLLLKSGSVVFTERVAVLIAVQIFFWGCFAFISAVARRRAWSVTPFLALLTYGAVFRMGFFNFYISIGICAGAIALAWRPRRQRRWLAIPLLGLAYTAHLIPCIWAIGVIGYRFLARHLRPSHRLWLFAAGLLSLACLALFLGRFVASRWAPSLPLDSSLGVDQVLTYGLKYKFVAACLVPLWVLLLIRRCEIRSPLRDTMFQLWALSAATCVLMPMSIWLSSYTAGLTYITIRLSLFSDILLLALIAPLRFTKLENMVSVAIVSLFFSFAYVDERAVNSVEQDVAAAIATLPPGTRVVAELKDSHLYVPALEHLADRECIGRCFDFGNYEAATTHFRLRAAPGNSYVMTDIDEIGQLEYSEYVWNRRDIDLVKLTPCIDGRHVCASPVKPGERLAQKQIDSVPKWWGGGDRWE